MFWKDLPILQTLFFAAWIKFGSGADVVVYGNNGSFFSPNYPANYPNNIEQLYRAVLDTPGPKQVRLHYVYEVQNKLIVLGCVDKIKTPELSLEFCGTGNVEYDILLHGNEFNITFKTSYIISDKGFVITYHVLQNTSEDTILHSNNGTFLSPDYPSNYSNDLHLVYRAKLSTSGPQQVRVDYTIDLEERDTAANPCHDSIWIPEVDMQLCGTKTETAYLSIEGNELTVIFTTDERINMTGFNFTYTVLEGNCEATVDLGTDQEHLHLVPITDILTRNNLVLSVRTCSLFKLYLTPLPDPQSGLRKEVTITDDSLNIKSCSGTLSNCQTESGKPGSFLNCCQFLSFWISWTSTNVAIGNGTTVYSNHIASLTESFNVTVRFIYVMTPLQGEMALALGPLPGSYCERPAPSSPTQCPTTNSSPTTSVVTDVTTTQSSPQTSTTNSPDVTTTDSTTNVVSTASGAIVTTTNSPDVTTTDSTTNVVSTASGAIVTTTGSPDVTTTDSTTNVVSTASGAIVTTTGSPDVTTTDSTTNVVSTASGAIVTTSSPNVTTTDSTTNVVSTASGAIVTTTNSPGVTTTDSTTNVVSTASGAIVTTTGSPDVTTTDSTTNVVSTASGAIVTTTNSPGVTTTDSTTNVVSTASGAIVTTTGSPDSSTTNQHSTSISNDVTTTNSQPTTPDQNTVAVPESAKCRCSKETSFSFTNSKALEEKKTELAQAIKKELTMTKSNVSATVRRKTTAEDERDSSTYMGFVVGLICFSPLVLIVVSDCLILITQVTSTITSKLCSSSITTSAN